MYNNEDNSEKTEEQYEYEMEQINEMFPHANFSICIDIEDLDEVVTNKSDIMIKNTYTCHCYDNCRKNTEYYHISGKHITNRYIINKLIEQGLNLDCDHHFLEGFYQMKNSECQFEMVIGS